MAMHVIPTAYPYSRKIDFAIHVDTSYIPFTHFMPYSRSSLSSKATGEEVPMDANPAYGEVNIYDTVKEQKEN